MITYHAYERAYERGGLKKEAAKTLIKEAIRYGKNADFFKSTRKEYLLQLEKDGGNLCEAVYHKSFVFIITPGNACKTVFKAPEWFMYDLKIP